MIHHPLAWNASEKSEGSVGPIFRLPIRGVARIPTQSHSISKYHPNRQCTTIRTSHHTGAQSPFPKFSVPLNQLASSGPCQSNLIHEIWKLCQGDYFLYTLSANIKLVRLYLKSAAEGPISVLCFHLLHTKRGPQLHRRISGGD